MILATAEHGWEGFYLIQVAALLFSVAVPLATAFLGACVLGWRGARNLWYKLHRGTDQR